MNTASSSSITTTSADQCNKSKKRKFAQVSNESKEELDEFHVSKLETLIEKTKHLSDMFDKSSLSFAHLRERFKQIENDWTCYYSYYFFGDESKEESTSG